MSDASLVNVNIATAEQLDGVPELKGKRGVRTAVYAAWAVG